MSFPKREFCFLLILHCLASALHAAGSPPHETVQVTIEDPNRDDDAWSVSIYPAPEGGKANQIVATNKTNTRAAGSGMVTLLVGKQYTFQLLREVVAQKNGFDEYKISFASVSPSGGIGGEPDWTPAGGNPPLQDKLPWESATKPPNVSGIHWTYTINPKIGVVAKDISRSPNIFTYLAADTADSNGKVTICADVRFFGPASPVTNITSSRNAGSSSIDKFAPTAGSPNASGYFQTVLKTTDTTSSSGSIAVKGKLAGVDLTAPAFAVLPAVCAMKYSTTVYYTPKESGFLPNQGWDLRPRVAGNTGHSYPSSFLDYVMVEGIGRVTTPVSTSQGACYYLAYDAGVFSYLPSPVGIGKVPLEPKKSCAFAKNGLPKFCKLITEDATIQKIFGNQTWTTADHGPKVNAGHLDLYWGDGNPRPYGDHELGDVNFPNTTGTVVLFSSYKTP